MKNLKKLTLLGIAAFLLLTLACNKDEKKEPVILLSKITSTFADGGSMITFEYNEKNQLIITTEDFTFDGNTENNLHNYTYDADGKISEDLFTFQGKVLSKTKYAWSLNTLESVSFNLNESDELVEHRKLIEELNSDGNPVKIQSYFKNAEGNWTAREYSLYTFENSNCITIENYFNSGVETEADYKYLIQEFEFDTKLNPFRQFGITFDLNGLNINNITKYTSLDQSPAASPYEYYYTYEYNGNNYPTKKSIKRYSAANEEIIREDIYEYITK